MKLGVSVQHMRNAELGVEVGLQRVKVIKAYEEEAVVAQSCDQDGQCPHS